MTTTPDSVTYTQAISDLGGPSDAFSWSSTYRPPYPLAGMFGFATDTSRFEFYTGSAWQHPAMLEASGTQTFTGNIAINGTFTLPGGTATGFGTNIGEVPLWVNFNGSGFPGLKTSSRLIIGRTTAGAGDFADLQINRTTTSVVSTNTAVNNAGLRVIGVTGAQNQTSEWGIVSQVTNNQNTGAGNTAAIIGYGFKTMALNGAFTFGGVFGAFDSSGLPSSTAKGTMVGAEIDVAGYDVDDAVSGTMWGGVGNRVALNIVAMRQSASGSAQTQIAQGIWFSTSTNPISAGSDSHTNFNSMIGAAIDAQAYQMLDSRGVIAPTGYTDPMAAVRMSAGQIIDFNGGAAQDSGAGNWLGYTTTGTARLRYVSGASTELASIDNSGNAITRGTLQVNSSGAAPVTISSGIISVPASQSLSIRVSTAGQTIGLGAPSAGLGNPLLITPQSGGNTAQSASPNLVTIGNMLEVPFYRSSTGTYSITGDSTWISPFRMTTGFSGTNTSSGSTGPAAMKLSGTYSASLANGVFNIIGIYQNASGFDGALTGVKAQLVTTGTSALSSPSHGLIASELVAIGDHNVGGSSTGFGSTQFGTGVLFGNNPRALLKGGGTYWAGVVGQESAGAIYSGATAGYFAVHQFVIEDSHAVHGVLRDCMAMFGAQVNATIGVREVIEIGGAGVHWPVDANGYLFAGHIPATQSSKPAAAAGGFDVIDVDFTGTGTWGGGFVLRGHGVSLIPSTGNGGAVRAGFASLTSTSGGATIDVDQDQMTGTPVINAGGSNWQVNHIAGDVYGNVVQITTVSAGAVTGITVLRRAFVPTGTGGTTGVAFTCKNNVSSSIGSGLTLNLTWTTKTDLTVASSGKKLAFYGGTPQSKQTVTGAKGGNVALANLMTALANLGLVTDSTT